MGYKAIDVTPKKWTNIIVLYDDDTYSVCWGNYEGSLNRKLAVRWNDNFPRQGANPTWYIEYDKFHKEQIEILIRIYEKKDLLNEEEKSYYKNCKIAYEEAK